MDLHLHRIDYLRVQAMSQGTMVILPVGKKKQQKVCVGDDSGVLTVLFMKKGEVNTEWKSPALGREISSVVLQLGKDKVFLGCGQSIHGFTRKGKEFVKIKTNLTETINHLFVEENMIWTGGEYIMNIYDQCKDFGFVMVKDRINAMTCAPIAPGDMLSSVLACQDKFLRVFASEKLYHEFSVEGPATALGFYSPQPVTKTPSKPGTPLLMLYGTETGIVGLTAIDQSAMRQTLNISDRQMRPGAANGQTAKRRARVTVIRTGYVAQSGAPDILVARDDGNFEVWSVGDVNPQGRNGMEQVPPTLAFEVCIGESIHAMDTGCIAGGEHNEVVMTTYGGKILGFTPDRAAQDPTGTEMGQVEDLPTQPVGKKKVVTPAEEKSVQIEKERRFTNLKADVDKLQKEVDIEKAAYQKVSQEGIAVQTTTKVSDRFILSGEEACYILTVESQSPIEMISLRADVEVDLLDHEGTSAILSRSKGDPSNPLLATYRMQEPGTRFQIRLRTVEGLHGTISCFVLPQTNPKTAHLVSLAVKPLSLHEKVNEPPSGDVPMNELTLKGNFTMANMHQWLGLCVNELPARPTDDEMSICYKSTFVGTILTGKYAKGWATLRSDSITTISVLKDLITREATAKKIQIQINVDVKDETFPRFLELLHPKLAFQHSLTQQVRLVEPLREVQLQEGETKFLAPELQMVLQHASEIQQQFELQPQRLAFLHSIVISLFKHKWRLRGHQSVEHRVKDLQKLLENYSLEQIVAFFDEPLN